MSKLSLYEETLKGILTENAFNMEDWGQGPAICANKGDICGTVGCIAGHIMAAGIRLGLKSIYTMPYDVSGTAQTFWSQVYGSAEGLEDLFYGKFSHKALGEITPEEAAEALTYYYKEHRGKETNQENP